MRGRQPGRPTKRVYASVEQWLEIDRSGFHFMIYEKWKQKRKLSAAGKAAIVAALKKRWAAKRAEAAGTKKTAAKKPHSRGSAPATPAFVSTLGATDRLSASYAQNPS